MDLNRWNNLLTRMNLAADESTYQRLVNAYSSPQRHYHNVQHIHDCLQQLDIASELAESADNVELALWFHDAVYRTWSGKNEYHSAQWASDFLQQAGATNECREVVYQHIMATCHFASNRAGHGLSKDSELVVDIDLSILGRDPATFMQFEKNIRREYRWVPTNYFKRRRRRVLQSFLAQDVIYRTDFFRDRYEASARKNLAQAIKML